MHRAVPLLMILAGCISEPALWVTISGEGTVTSDPSGIDCGRVCATIVEAPITLTATPAAGWQFASWTGGGCTTGDTCSPRLDGDETIVATFEPVYRELVVTVSGTGSGFVLAAGIDCGGDCTEAYLDGTMVQLTARPYPGPPAPHFFVGWTMVVPDDTSAAMCGRAETCTITMDRDHAVGAMFMLP